MSEETTEVIENDPMKENTEVETEVKEEVVSHSVGGERVYKI